MFTLPPLPNIEPQAEGARWALNANDTGISGRILTHLVGQPKWKPHHRCAGTRLQKGRAEHQSKRLFSCHPRGRMVGLHPTRRLRLAGLLQGHHRPCLSMGPAPPTPPTETAPTDTYRGLDDTVRHLTPYEGSLQSDDFHPDENNAPIMVQTPINHAQDDVFGMPTPLLGAIVQSVFSNFFEPNTRLVSSDLELDSALVDAGHPDLYDIPRFRLKGVVSYIPDNTQVVRQTEHRLRQLVASDPKLFLGPNSFGQKFGKHSHSGSNWAVEPSFKFIQKLHPQARQSFSSHLVVQAEKICQDHGLQKIIAKTT